MGIQSKDKRDIYYYKAKKLGYRARSAFKLIGIDNKFNLIADAKNIVDLCAAPGSWSQVLSREAEKNKINDKIHKKIIAVDVQEIHPIDNVKCLKEDITSKTCLEKILEYFSGESADLIICDGAPDVTGFHDLDEYLQAELLKASLSICQAIGREGSSFIGKCFRSGCTGYLVKHFMKFYEDVHIVKPMASRGASVECFIVCRNMKIISDDPKNIDFECDPVNFEVLRYDDGPDPDFANEINEDYTKYAEYQPINPPYKEAVERRKNN